jgi:hypothetical protein
MRSQSAAPVCSGSRGAELPPLLEDIGLCLGIRRPTFDVCRFGRAVHGLPKKAVAIWGTSLGAVSVALSIIGFVIVYNAFS